MYETVIQEKIALVATLPPEYQERTLAFLDDLVEEARRSEKWQGGAKRVLGGLEEDFWMADDFDATPECFKDYV